MGNGYKIKCKKCGYDYRAMLGVGMLFPSLYEKTVSEIKEGKYGEDYKKFFEDNPDAAVNCEAVLAVCEQCGNFSTVNDLSLYVPKKSDDAGMNVGYVMAEELESDYKKCRSYPHKCFCGGSLKVIDMLDELSKNAVRCPKCKGEMQLTDDFMMWD